jgi:hypothetical protein
VAPPRRDPAMPPDRVGSARRRLDEQPGTARCRLGVGAIVSAAITRGRLASSFRRPCGLLQRPPTDRSACTRRRHRRRLRQGQLAERDRCDRPPNLDPSSSAPRCDAGMCCCPVLEHECAGQAPRARQVQAGHSAGQGRGQDALPEAARRDPQATAGGPLGSVSSKQPSEPIWAWPAIATAAS